MNCKETIQETPPMSNIEVYSKLNDPIKDIEQLGNVFAKCGMFKNCDQPEKGQMLALISMVEQKSPFYIMNNFHIMDDGRLTKTTKSADADFRSRGGTVEWIKTGLEPDQTKVDRYAEAKLTYNGQSVQIRFSMHDAEAAGFLRAKSQWEKMPWRMLQKAVLREGFGLLCPEIYFEDDAGGPQSVPPKEIKLEESAVVTNESSPAPSAASEPIEAEVVEPAPETKPEQTEPQAEVVPAAEEKPSKAEEEPQAKPILSDDVAQKVQDAIGKHLGQDSKLGIDWLVQKKWLPKGKPVEFMSEENAHNILKFPKQFAAKVRKEMKA